MTEREVMEYDVVIVGAGPAGLACAIRLKQLKPDTNICVLEKASTIGAHILSGAVIEPGPLDELLPELAQRIHRHEGAGGRGRRAADDEDRLVQAAELGRQSLADEQSRQLHRLARCSSRAWLAQQAESARRRHLPGLRRRRSGARRSKARVKGVRIGDMGLDKDGTPGPELHAGHRDPRRHDVLAEGSRGSLTKQLIAKYNLREGIDPPTFGLGFKELWQLPPGRVKPGRIEHAFGWPLDTATYGGSFLYHLDRIACTSATSSA